MVNLYTLPTYVIVLFIGVILCLFLANSVLYYYLMPQAQFRQLGRKCLEGSSLLLLMAVATILYEVYTDSLNGIVYDEATDFWRYSTALAGTAGAVYWIHDRQAGSLWVLAASILLLPVFDDWLPGSLVLALVCLAWRLIRLFPRTYNQYQQRLTARSIQTAVDCLDEGILISWEKGEPVLVNFTMYAVMEQLVGTVVRNANIFWHLLPFCGNRPGLSMERQGRDLLFRWDSGQAWLLQRRPIRFRRQSGWQITAANVTALHRLNQELAQKNAVLEQRNEEMKDVLDGLVALQTRQTTESLRYKIHDLLGQRITILQQLLNNPNVSDYGEILPLVEDVLSDLRRDAVANPQERLDALVTTYRNLGIARDGRRDVACRYPPSRGIRAHHPRGHDQRLAPRPGPVDCRDLRYRPAACFSHCRRRPGLSGPHPDRYGPAGYGAAGTGVRRPSDADQDTALYHYCRNGGEP